MGPGNYSIWATSEVDNGAMRNCVSKECWDQYVHFLSALHPLSTQITVTNGTKLKPLGKWFRTIHVSGVSTASWFEVFDSHRTFDIILGKPWLTQVKVTHDYSTDQLSITNNGTTEILLNEASMVQTKEPEPTPTNMPVMPVTVDPKMPPEDQLDSVVTIH